jgi:hypothetical protein
MGVVKLGRPWEENDMRGEGDLRWDLLYTVVRGFLGRSFILVLQVDVISQVTTRSDHQPTAIPILGHERD